MTHGLDGVLPPERERESKPDSSQSVLDRVRRQLQAVENRSNHHDTDGGEKSSRDPASARYVRRGMRVLVVDDDEIAREVIGDILRGAGHEVFHLSSAIGATQAIFQYDVEAVVVDVNMPTVTGDKLARMLRSSKKGESLWVVLVSGQTDAELRRLAVEAQADATVSKDAIHTQLLDAMARGARRVANS